MSKRAVVASVLEELWAENGRLTPEDVVERATPVGSPLHAFFEWDDAGAAHQHRLNQARGLIRSVKIKVLTDDDELIVRGWHAVRHAGIERAPRGYLPMAEIEHDPLAQAALLRQAQREIVALRRRYGHLSEFWRLARAELSKDAEQAAG